MSNYLQKESLDVNTAVDLIDTTITLIRELRTDEALDTMDSSTNMSRESNATTEFAEERVCKRKRHSNENTDDDPIQDSRCRFKSEVYFYILYIFVGRFRLQFRLSDFKEMAKLFMVLNPKHFEHPDVEEKMLELAHFYSEDISKPK